MIIKIEPNHLSTKRTKERIKQHGPFFNLEDGHSGFSRHGGVWLLREANPKKGKEPWLGWVQRKEFTVINGLPHGFSA